ncbi:hypothetical protein Srubr_20050 [Streptomyces rubradiris]|uniref:Transposase n=1 Tax=Streptomyces rubradiris TaxID=285531 RepID=A0ABQ3R8J2_STRRR|nr:hypothetical protein GCM10018792_59790 [Streptomyces rubradiris]GHI52159.1 hypothetical protein Srubr_20050 [Streptomyces rubradiris]
MDDTDNRTPGSKPPSAAAHRPGRTPLVRLAEICWRIEHDYRALEHGLGLNHFEGRSWTGWHHHVTLVTAAHAFLTERRTANGERPQRHPIRTRSVPDPRHPPGHPEVRDRHLHHLPPAAARTPTQTPNSKSRDNPTESY